MDRRQFLKIAALAPAVAAVPVALAKQEPMRWRNVQQYTLNDDPLPIRPEFDTELQMSDMREVTQYDINEDVFHLRHDICFTVNSHGKKRQYNVNQLIFAGEPFESLNEKRTTALQMLQGYFDRFKRIRANLVPLQMPRNMLVPTAEEIIRGVR
jgi:hypothetical protein